MFFVEKVKQRLMPYFESNLRKKDKFKKEL
jgi:hypothetical protein